MTSATGRRAVFEQIVAALERSGAVCEGSPSSSRPPLVCQICEAAAGGRYEGRNLYEVCAEMPLGAQSPRKSDVRIVPKCEALRVSYVELLRRGRKLIWLRFPA